MNYTALKTLLDSDPATASMTDAEAAAWCNEKAHSQIGSLPISTIASRWLNAGVWDSLLAAANDTGHAAHALAKGVVTVVKEARTLGLENFDFSLTRPNQLIIGLRDAGFIDQAEVDTIIEIATIQISRAQNAGIAGTVYPEDITKARAL